MSKRILQVEVRDDEGRVKVWKKANKSNLAIKAGEKIGIIMVTPPVGEDYWLARVPLSDKQALVCFPKFGTIGIGFQVEEDWNTNLPYSCETEEIYKHIKHNKGARFWHTTCLRAIRLLQEFAREYMANRA